jgi:hypothetical protein
MATGALYTILGFGRANLILLTLTRLVHLHSDPLALRTPPFSLLVVDVSFEFLHGDFAAFAGHDIPFVSMIALA